MRKKIIRIAGIFVSLVVLILAGSCEDEEIYFETEDQFPTIEEYIKSDSTRYGIFYKMMQIGNLSGALSSYNPNGNNYTLFLPNDSAINEYVKQSENYNNVQDLLDDTDFVKILVRYHVVNLQIRSNDFPFGALPDTTLTGDILTIGFSNDLDTTIYKVNNEAPIIRENIEASNGYVHVISKVLEPIIYSSYEILSLNPDFSILAGALELTGINDRMGIYKTDDNGFEVKNNYTILAEPDSIYHKKGIHSIDDLIAHINPADADYTNMDNAMYQFAAYHILEGNYFLDNFEGSVNYNTWASLPVRIEAGFNIRINRGVANFDTVVSGKDTSVINYIEPFYDESNILSKNGPIHLITEILELYKPGRTSRVFQFYEEPLINNVKNKPNAYPFTIEDFTVLTWEGVEEITYVKSGSESEKSSNQDYIQIDGDFSISYSIPRILPGNYLVEVRANGIRKDNAIIQVFIDNKKIGGNINLTSGGSGSNPYAIYELGEFEFSSYEPHVIRIVSLIPGNFTWDFIRFSPV